MLSNHLYNLMLQVTEESKSLKRIKSEYLTDAPDCPDCKMLWERLAEQKESNIEDLKMLIKTHLEQG